MAFRIFTDTSANIPTDLAEKYNIGIVPLSYNIEGEEHECLDTREFDSEAYYKKMKDGVKITTSQINPQKYINYMEETVANGEDILFIGMSAGISGSFGSAQIAATQLMEKYPERKINTVDSSGASLGEGLQVLYAEKCKAKGMTLEEITKLIEDTKMNMYQLFTVDDLMHLKRGGRLSNASAILGSILHIKPVLKGNEEGKIVAFEKVRGRKAVLNRLVKKYDELILNDTEQVVGISYCACKEEAELVAKMMQENHHPQDIMMVEHEPVTGSYLGPGAIAIYFYGDKDVRLK